VLEKLGVTETVFPEWESGLRLARRVATPNVLNDVRLGEDFSIQEVAVPEAWVGKTLRRLELPRTHRLAVVAVRDVLHDSLTTVPDPDSALLESNTLLVAGRAEDLARLAK
jgi:trk system potassium uptake protein TrkA